MSALPTLKPGQVADVGLLLEGTYPYVSGGVSSWMHQIVTSLGELTFALVFIGGSRDGYGEPRFRLPPNVVHVERHFLADACEERAPRAREGNAAAFEDMARLHQHLRAPAGGGMPDLLERASRALGEPGVLTREDFLHSERAWEYVRAEYLRAYPEGSFLDYFWSVRLMHAPLFQLAEVAKRAPAARVFHAISTGYAGFLGALLHHRRGAPFLLTEHGIYTKERKIDLAQAAWIKDREPEGAEGVGYLRGLWIRFFEGLGRMTYSAAEPIISLYEGNRRRQIQDGAAEARTRVIPNGIALDRFAPLRAARPPGVPKVLGLLGRVVPIKDIRTFVRAMRTVCDRVPDAEGWVIGPEDEDAAYARECRELAKGLGLEERVKFLGFQKPEAILPKLGLLVLTSISEALPLVLLEGFASGLPAVATDVGCCRDLIEGNGPEDKALGTAGRVVRIADPAGTAAAALELLTDEARWRAAQEAGVRRVERFYVDRMMFDAYRAIYREALEASDGGDRLRAS